MPYRAPRFPRNATSLGPKIWNWVTHPFTKITLATIIADAVAKHPVLAHTYTRAKSIRKGELLDVLKDLSSDTTIATIDSATKAKLKKILAAQLPGGAATADTAQALSVELEKKLGGRGPDNCA